MSVEKVNGGWTKGPWAVHPRFAYVIPAEHAERPIGGAEDDAYDLAHYAQEICALHRPDRHRPEAETRANARLIAAAPDLYEALAKILESGVSIGGDHRALARAALSRATQQEGGL